jgi:hypothetical protein
MNLTRALDRGLVRATVYLEYYPLLLNKRLELMVLLQLKIELRM